MVEKHTNGSKNFNRMKDAEKFQFHKWLDGKRNDIDKFKSLSSIAKAAQKELGFQITKHNVSSSLKIVGIEYKPKNGNVAGLMPKVHQRVCELETKVSTVQEENRRLNEKVEGLQKLLEELTTT